MATILCDGMNLEGRVDAMPNAWPEVRFTYRLAKDYWTFQYERLSFLPVERGHEVTNIISNILKEHLIEVSVIGESKVPERIDVDASNLNMFPGSVRVIMCEYILGRRSPVLETLLPK